MSLGSAGEQHAETKSIGRRAQKGLARLEKMSRLFMPALTGVQQPEVAGELAFRDLIAEGMREAHGSLEPRLCLVGAPLALDDDAEVAKHDGLELHIADVSSDEQRGPGRCFGFSQAILNRIQHAQVAKHVALEAAMADRARGRQRLGEFENLRRAPCHADRIFKGAKPAEMPIEQGTKFDLVVDLETAKLTTLVVPQSLLARADDLIEQRRRPGCGKSGWMEGTRTLPATS
jgi:hypothetical protein